MDEDLSQFSTPMLKDVVHDLRELLSQSGLALLFGAGCSKKAGLPLMGELTSEVLTAEGLDEATRSLLESIRDMFDGATTPTIEDYMSEMVDLFSIAERRQRRGASALKIALGGQGRDAPELEKSLQEVQQAISSCITGREVDVAAHRGFVKAIHAALQAGKPPRTVDYFVMNYDTLIEDALGLERIPYSDGFTGAATGWWDPVTFDSSASRTRVFKLHGSIDWCVIDGDPLPRRIRPGILKEAISNRILIYPAATKYQETQRDPFAQMLTYMRKSLCPLEGKETVLALCGYSFADAHINLEIDRALRESNGRLTVAAFVSSNKPESTLKRWIDDPQIGNQVRVYANRGFFHGTEALEVDKDTPWWRFEILARLLGGER